MFGRSVLPQIFRRHQRSDLWVALKKTGEELRLVLHYVKTKDQMMHILLARVGSVGDGILLLNSCNEHAPGFISVQ